MERHEHYAILVEISREAGVEMTVLGECVERRIIPAPHEADRAELARLARRIRRLRTLGLDMAGLEIVLPLRERYRALMREHLALRSEIEMLRAQLWGSEPSPPPSIEGEVVTGRGG
jgi:hypothetical protein